MPFVSTSLSTLVESDGIVSAGNLERLYDEKVKTFRRIPKRVMLNFTQRTDVLPDWIVEF